MVEKKKSTKIRPSGGVSKKKPKALARPQEKYRHVKSVAVGADISYYSMSVAGIAELKSGGIKAAAVSRRWDKGTDYFERMRQAAKAHEIMLDLFTALKIGADLDQVHIAMEEAASFGHVQRGASGVMKQQIQISGAFMGGLLRWGWTNIEEIAANKWRKMVADDIAETYEMDFTIHTSKWNNPELLPMRNVTGKNVGKYRAQQWVEIFHPEWDGKWPDIISSNKLGMIPRPENIRAQGRQSDDRYEAFAQAEWIRRQISDGDSR